MKRTHRRDSKIKNLWEKIKRPLIFIVCIFALLETVSIAWLYLFASEEERLEYTLYSRLPDDKQRFKPHHYMNYVLNPEYQKGKAFHNSLGYRDIEFEPKKPEGTFRIIVLGGSTVYTVYVEDNEKTFTSQLGKILKDKYGYENVQVINGGVGGYSSWETMINLGFNVLDIEPDLLIVYQGGNDVHTRFVDPESYKADNSGRRRQWKNPDVIPLEYSAFFRIVLRNTGLSNQPFIAKFVNSESSYRPKSLEEQDAMEMLNKNPPVYFRRNMNNIVAISKANGVDILLSTWGYSANFDDYASKPYYQRGFIEHNEIIKEVGRLNGVPVFDFASYMPEDKRFWVDGRHVNEAGARKKAELFAEFLHNEDLINNSGETLISK